MVFVDKKVIAFALVAVAAILVIGVLVMLPKIEELKPVRKSAPLVNVSDYSYKVSVEKPELFFQELGDAKKAGEKGIKAVVFDRGGFQYVGTVKAFADAARAAGLEF